MLKTLEDFKNHAQEKGYANGDDWAEKAFARKQAEDKVFFHGNRDELIALFAKRKKDNPAAEADKTLAKRAELQKEGKRNKTVAVFESGTLEEIVAYLDRERPDITNKEAYAKGVMRKRLDPVFQTGTPAQVEEAKAITEPAVEDKFTQMIKFAKSGKLDQGVLSDEEAEKFARNVVRKQLKAELESKDPVRVRKAVEQLHVKNVDAYVAKVLEGDTQ